MHNDYASRASEYICLCMQFSVGEAGVPDFQKALEPLRQLLAEYPYLGGKGPSYSDHFVAGFFMVGLPPLILNFLCSLMCSLLGESSAKILIHSGHALSNIWLVEEA